MLCDLVSGDFDKSIVCDERECSFGAGGIGVQCMLACGRPPLAPTIDPKGGGAGGAGEVGGTGGGVGEDGGTGFRGGAGRGGEPSASLPTLACCPPCPLPTLHLHRFSSIQSAAILYFFV